jgi:hypothetical protein
VQYGGCRLHDRKGHFQADHDNGPGWWPEGTGTEIRRYLPCVIPTFHRGKTNKVCSPNLTELSDMIFKLLTLNRAFLVLFHRIYL